MMFCDFGDVIFTTLGGYFDDMGSFWEHFYSIFRALDQFEHPDDPQGPPEETIVGPGSPKGGHFGYQNPYKIDKISTLEPVRFLN